jgi:hypothetical protein
MIGIVTGLLAGLLPRPAFACSVCFGDPESPQAKGVAAAVSLLVGITGFVLMGIVSTGLVWAYRGRHAQREVSQSNPDESRRNE